MPAESPAQVHQVDQGKVCGNLRHPAAGAPGTAAADIADIAEVSLNRMVVADGCWVTRVVMAMVGGERIP